MHVSMRDIGFLLMTIAMLSGCGDDLSAAGEGDTSAESADAESGLDDSGLAGDTGEGPTDTAQPDDTAQADAGAVDTSSSDADSGNNDADGGGDSATLDCPGAAGCACEKNSACDSGACLDTQDGKVCAKSCTDTCATGFKCKAFGNEDAFFVCFPQWTSLCSPCAKHTDCKTEGSEAKCIDYGAAGTFCGASCGKDDECPTGYTCGDYFDKDANKTFKQCQLQDPKAECSCSEWAKSAAFSTPCEQSNAVGTCKGERKCAEAGLSACSAAIPAAELCDGADNNCDGTVDNLPVEATCSVDATLPDGTKASCPGTPKCDPSGKIVCEGAITPSEESCDTQDNDCDGKTDEDFAWTDPSDEKTKVTVGGACGLGPCVGGQVICKNPTAAVCDSEQKLASKELCDGKDNDCDGTTDNDACADGDECTVDKCDSGKCSNDPGTDCDDSNACTKDSCDAQSGKCVNDAVEGSCDDGNACTVGDACKIADGKATCAAGTDKPNCEDANLCTDDSCDQQKGCTNLPNAVTQTCYSGAQGTAGTGTCAAGMQVCKAGVLDKTCVGEVVPAAQEACDGKDDTCDGKTDETCSIIGVQADFVAVAGAGGGAKHDARISIGGGSIVGGPAQNQDGKYDIGAGFLEWLSGLLDGPAKKN